MRYFEGMFSRKPLTSQRLATTGPTSTGSGPTDHFMQGIMTTYSTIPIWWLPQASAQTIVMNSFEITSIGGRDLLSGYAASAVNFQETRTDKKQILTT